MGSGIATACALAGLTVLLKEINQKFLDVSLSPLKGCRFASLCLNSAGLTVDENDHFSVALSLHICELSHENLSHGNVV